eukprot:12850853-Alexandrium_andersonii.AAC.1
MASFRVVTVPSSPAVAVRASPGFLWAPATCAGPPHRPQPMGALAPMPPQGLGVAKPPRRRRPLGRSC